ncbi:hypothetical protein RJ639_010797 [Escallonia herrerae]|uniref:Plasma membrane-associated cation-binding protein 1 n=1 Tax=Escallonia herrerae TaxID=1293975 RepID=A0AA89APM8_9ASTE|nr:hypothetical protein RJ639_010797 [Escallonia herrerae]
MGYWKSKVLPKIKKIFEKTNGVKKAAATEACKSFDESKEEYTKVFEEKKGELQPKVIEIYEASSTEIKSLVKEPKEAGLKKHSAGVEKLLDELAKIEFPGSKPVHEASTKYGPALVSGPVFFVFEKVSTFIVEEKKEEVVTEEASGSKEKEIVVEEEEKKEEVVAAAEVVAEPEPEKAAEPEPAKVEEAPPAAAEPPKP